MHYSWQKFSKAILIAVAFFALSFSLAPALAHADVKSDLQGGVDTAAGSTGEKPEDRVNSLIKTVINLLSVAVGIVAVIMIIVGGFRYVTSAGDSTKVGSAKNTILYALIGLIIVALAQVIVHFVLAKTTGPVCSGGHWDSGPKSGQACT